MSRWLPAAVLATTAALALAGCGNSETPAAPAGSSSSAPTVTGDITVFAAASLTEAFTKIGKDFEAANPGVKVKFNFAGSSALAQQINQGAPADVFASAAPTNMKQVTDTGTITAKPVAFVTNTLEISIPAGNPGKVTGLPDFAKQELKIVLCAEQVPCGAATKKVFATAGVTPAPDSLEQDVK